MAGRWDGGLRAPTALVGFSAPGPRCTRVSSHLSDCQYLRLPPDRPSRAPWPEPPAPPEAPCPGPFFPLHVVDVTSSRLQDTQCEAAPAYRPGLLLHLLPPGPPTSERVRHVHPKLWEKKHQAGEHRVSYQVRVQCVGRSSCGAVPCSGR